MCPQPLALGRWAAFLVISSESEGQTIMQPVLEAVQWLAAQFSWVTGCRFLVFAGTCLDLFGLNVWGCCLPLSLFLTILFF